MTRTEMLPDISPDLLEEVRGRFAHVATCPFEGERIFFENAGGALTLNSVVETSARLAAIPDNQGRDNPASRALVAMIDKAKEDMAVFFNAPEGRFLVGESGTELLFRLLSVACLGSAQGGIALGSTLEHPASRSAARRWAEVSRKRHVLVAHDDATGSVDPAHYLAAVTADTRVATIVHTSPVTGMGVDVAAIAAAIRTRSPACYIIVDGIQHAAHGRIDIASYGIDGYVVSPYKVFSRHGYGLAWMSERLATLPHDHITDSPGEPWELGTRDTGAYATFSDVVAYFEWLGSKVGPATDRRGRIVAAGEAIRAHEHRLCEAALHGTGNLAGLAEIEGIRIIGGLDNPRREGLVSFAIDGIDTPALVEKLGQRGVRVHTRKADHYSGNVLQPLGLENCVRVSLCHYNTEAEIAVFLHAVHEIVSGV